MMHPMKVAVNWSPSPSLFPTPLLTNVWDASEYNSLLCKKYIKQIPTFGTWLHWWKLSSLYRTHPGYQNRQDLDARVLETIVSRVKLPFLPPPFPKTYCKHITIQMQLTWKIIISWWVQYSILRRNRHPHEPIILNVPHHQEGKGQVPNVVHKQIWFWWCHEILKALRKVKNQKGGNRASH